LSGDPGKRCNGTGTPFAIGFDIKSTTRQTPREAKAATTSLVDGFFFL
jgi:hypothetical protein